ncbi:Fic family protein [Actinosynnema sp. NPDC050801]|uniref:type II toxin-antitoxin system death-on-curing family toxin n=1 Tax=unclassified Actinosynnema TaxID=2637065 RepID=UPI0033CF34C9
MNPECLTLEELPALADDLGVPKVRDLGLLDSAAHRPRSSLMGQDAYGSLDERAAVLMESILRNPPLVDGNKRLGAGPARCDRRAVSGAA